MSIDGRGASVTGVLRDSSTNWLWGTKCVLVTNLFLRLKCKQYWRDCLLHWDKGFRNVEVEYDNILLIELILSGGGVNISLVEACLLHQVLCRK